MIILAGGSGTRLWPLSRGSLPKHLLALTDDKTLLQQTAERLIPLASPEKIYTVTHELHRFEVQNQLQSVHANLGRSVLSEPKANNTLAAIGWAVALIAQKDPHAVIGVFPADHAIADNTAFHETLKKAFSVASDGFLVTFGITPQKPETGYGYIEAGQALDNGSAYRVASFTEKPDLQTAKSYLTKGNYYWNSGMFVFPASLFQSELQQFEPDIWKAMQRIVSSTESEKTLRDEYEKMKSVSIDYGLMEKSKSVAVLPSSFQWTDLGSWDSLYENLPQEENGNVTRGEIIQKDTSSSLLISQKGLIAAIGVKDMVVIKTDDSVLISPRNRVQEVKGIVEELKKRGSHLTEIHSTVLRPWGQYTVLEEGPGYKIKRIVVNPGQKLSLQKHKHRTEHWVVIEGEATVTKDVNTFVLKANESTYIAGGETHRLANNGLKPLLIIEVQTGSYLGEDDIQRLDDAYGRKN